MIRRIKNKIKEDPFLYAIVQLFKNHTDEQYLNIVNKRKYHEIMFIHETEQNNGVGNAICLLEVGSSRNGFCATLRWMLDGLFFCEKFGLVPYVKFAEDSMCKDPDMPETVNPFEYYFKQPFDVELEGKSYLRHPGSGSYLAEKLNSDKGYAISEEYIREMAQIMKKYLRFREEVENSINVEKTKRGVDSTYLGVHIRGTDFKANYREHPIYIDLQQYYPLIDKAMETYHFQKIFLATDDQEILQEFVTHYGQDKVSYAEDIVRGSGTIGIHAAKNHNKHNYQYTLGMEVLYDVCSLAACGGIISCMSQVNLIARIYKSSKDERYLVDERLNPGINKTGKYFTAP